MKSRRDARRTNKKGETWDQTVARLRNQCPEAFEDIAALEHDDVLGPLMHDVLNLGYTEVRRGSRPKLDRAVGKARLAEWKGEDFSVLPFHEAFAALMVGRSIRQTATLMDVSHTQVRRLLAGAIAPSVAEIEGAAAAFRKPPEYFREYRTAIICALTERLLETDPERSAALMRRLRSRVVTVG